MQHQYISIIQGLEMLWQYHCFCSLDHHPNSPKFLNFTSKGKHLSSHSVRGNTEDVKVLHYLTIQATSDRAKDIVITCNMSRGPFLFQKYGILSTAGTRSLPIHKEKYVSIQPYVLHAKTGEQDTNTCRKKLLCTTKIIFGGKEVLWSHFYNFEVFPCSYSKESAELPKPPPSPYCLSPALSFSHKPSSLSGAGQLHGPGKRHSSFLLHLLNTSQ